MVIDFAFSGRKTMMYNLNEKLWRCSTIMYIVKVQVKNLSTDGKEFRFSEHQDVNELSHSNL